MDACRSISNKAVRQDFATAQPGIQMPSVLACKARLEDLGGSLLVCNVKVLILTSLATTGIKGNGTHATGRQRVVLRLRRPNGPL